jgi:hypothetical protein
MALVEKPKLSLGEPVLLGEYTSEQLQKGLRSVAELPRNSMDLITCDGAIGYHGSLQSITAITALATSATITDGHPYPQLFLLPNLILIFGKTKIYEWVNSALVLKLTVTTGNPWTVVEYYDQLLMSNGVVTVERRPGDKGYAVRSDLPIGEALFNFGGQIIVGGLTAGSLA